MKRQHTQPENRLLLTAGDALPDSAGQPIGAAKESESLEEIRLLTAGAPHPARIVTPDALEGDAWGDDEESETRAGGVCLLIA